MSTKNRYFSAAYILDRLLRLLLPALLIAVAAGTAAAQDELLREGSRVRIDTRASRQVTGIVKSFDSDSVQLFTDENGAMLSLARNEMTALRVSHGKSVRRGAMKGAMWGAGVGGLAGVIFLAAVESDNTITVTGSDRSFIMVNSIVGSTIWGGVIGAFVRSERWESVSMRPRVTRSSSGARVGLSVQSALLH